MKWDLVILIITIKNFYFIYFFSNSSYYYYFIGKTLQTISLLAYLTEHHGHNSSHIVIVPKTTVSNWENEFKKWCPTLRTLRLLGTKEERQLVCKTLLKPGEFDVLICSYESCLKESSSLMKINWNYLIIDEVNIVIFFINIILIIII